MLSIFGSKEKVSGVVTGNGRVLRHSSGWGQILERMRSEESLRVLDIGPTSSGNINLITGLGHSVYLSNLVEDAAKEDWIIAQEDGAPGRYDVEGFLEAQFDLSGRGFDLVLFWDTADFLPEELLGPVLKRIHQAMAPGGQMLAMFHAQPGNSAAAPSYADFNRYHLTDASAVQVQRAGEYPLLHNYTNRQIERLLAAFKGFHFFLSKDNVREVVVTR